MTSDEVQTPLRVGVSRCPTHVGVGHLYDTRTTRIGKVKEVLQKIFKSMVVFLPKIATQ